MIPFEKCPVCGGELETKRVEKLLRGGDNTVALKVDADVCRHCGERLYAENVIKAFEVIRKKLEQHDFGNLKAVGQSFTIGKDWPDKAVEPAVFSE